jgi:hypothetical protein
LNGISPGVVTTPGYFCVEHRVATAEKIADDKARAAADYPRKGLYQSSIKLAKLPSSSTG